MVLRRLGLTSLLGYALRRWCGWLVRKSHYCIGLKRLERELPDVSLLPSIGTPAIGEAEIFSLFLRLSSL
ncbi:MAG: hypothetical protein OJF51_002451 [Nitrospira sp.]|nr:MAG: hypothetical protein OJF51_002451 [Nitrospira sp.]